MIAESDLVTFVGWVVCDNVFIISELRYAFTKPQRETHTLLLMKVG
jgi:hypothetical protein